MVEDQRAGGGHQSGMRRERVPDPLGECHDWNCFSRASQRSPDRSGFTRVEFRVSDSQWEDDIYIVWSETGLGDRDVDRSAQRFVIGGVGFENREGGVDGLGGRVACDTSERGRVACSGMVFLFNNEHPSGFSHDGAFGSWIERFEDLRWVRVGSGLGKTTGVVPAEKSQRVDP